MKEVPPLLLAQLASPGRMVIPIRPSGHDVTMIQVDKDAIGNISQKQSSLQWHRGHVTDTA